MQIFMSNNYDIKNQNTLDLHGLHVKEAIQVLKNVINEKKEGRTNHSIHVLIPFMIGIFQHRAQERVV